MRLTRVFLDVDLRQAFHGLRVLAKKAHTPVSPESSILFINAARTKFKLLRANKYLVCYNNGTRRIPLEAIAHLPQAFGGTDTEMTAEIRKSIEVKLGFIKTEGGDA